MTTGSERLDAALNGRPCDRIPVFCNLIDQGAREVGVSLRDYYRDGDLVAEAQLLMRARYGHDNVWSLFYVGKEAELLGCRGIHFADGGPPNVEEFVVRDAYDIAALRVPDDVARHEAFEQTGRCLRRLRQEIGGRFPICAYVSSSMTLPAMLMGMERWFELLFLGPVAQRDALLEKCHELFVKEIDAYRRGGADVIIYANPFGSTDTVPRRWFDEVSLPWIERDMKAVGVDGLVYYCGMSRMNRVLDTVLQRTGLGVCYLSPLDDVADGKRIVAGRALTCGVVNDMRLIDWSPEDVRREVERIIGAGRGGGRFLFGTGVMPLEIPEANIRALLDAAFEAGRWDGEAAS